MKIVDNVRPGRALVFRTMAALACGLATLSVSGGPVGGKVLQGNATFSSLGSQFTITTSDRAVISWQSFNIGVGQTTTFVQPSSSSVVWNQINDPSPSQILGNLNANGYVILQNPSGFYVGGQAAISAHGLLMTTSPIPPPDLSSGGAWQFNAPPPTASIINYGQINISGGGQAFLIAHDIENHGSITAPQGQIGLYAAQEVMISQRPDGRGLSARVMLPEGSVDNQGNLIADAGTIAMHAQVVNQGGLLQANSVRNVNGVIELVASDSLNLGASSVISATGDPTKTSQSPGGFVVLDSDNAFNDTAGSKMLVSGQNGGPDGIVQVFGSGTTASTIKSTIDDISAGQFASGNHLLVNTYDLTLSSDPTDTSSTSPTLSVADLSAYSKLALFAQHDINLDTWWYLPPSTDPNSCLTLEAARNITLLDGSAIQSDRNWNLELTAGTGLTSGAAPTAGTYGIYLQGNSFIDTQNGDINLWAANEVLVDTGGSSSVLNNGIRTLAGGNISVTTLHGNVNAGGNPAGYQYQSEAPYYSVSTGDNPEDPSLGGISTAAGGNVTINSGKNVYSYLPVASSGQPGSADAGAGAFGPEPGNVTITAAGSVFGHYVLANGEGTISAGQNVGGFVASQSLALSLIKGSWSVNAPNGNIYLQEVRNPNGMFNNQGTASSPGYHLFDYAPDASVSLKAGIGVYFTGLSIPRASDPVPILYPPQLSISAGSGGVVLQDDVDLFPSPSQALTISTSGNLTTKPNNPSKVPLLLMSDSAQHQWRGVGVFGTSDHGPFPLGLNSPEPVVIDVAGNMENLNLITTKKTEITVGGDMNNCGFSGQNLHAGDATTIEVGGRIYNRGSYSFLFLNQSIPNVPTVDLPGGQAVPWDYVFNLLLDPAKIAAIAVPTDLSPTKWAGAASAAALLTVGAGGSSNPGFVYDSSTGRLGFAGQMSTGVKIAMDTPYVVLRYKPDGTPVTYVDSQGVTRFQTDPVNFIPVWAVDALYKASADAPSLGNYQIGYRIGGPGYFNVRADSVSLGNSIGILSTGVFDTEGGYARFQNLASVTPVGATLNITVEHNLDLLTSTIAALGGGDVNVTSLSGSLDLGSQELLNTRRQLGFGLYTAGRGNVNVVASGDININGSRIASYNGGDISIESLHGDVNAGTGGTAYISVTTTYVDPVTGLGSYYGEQVFGSGIVANTLIKPGQVPGSAVLPGNIKVLTPEGNIYASRGGILQEALNGNFSGGPSVTLLAGTRGTADSPGHPGNIDLGDSGVIGGTVNADANGNITGLVISRQSSTINAAQSFSGTVLSGGTANLSAGGTISGTVVGIGGISASGGQGVTATLLSQNVSVAGSAQTQNTLGSSANATSTSQAAAQQATSDTQRKVGLSDTDSTDEKKKKKSPVLVRRVGRVTVILPAA